MVHSKLSWMDRLFIVDFRGTLVCLPGFSCCCSKGILPCSRMYRMEHTGTSRSSSCSMSCTPSCEMWPSNGSCISLGTLHIAQRETQCKSNQGQLLLDILLKKERFLEHTRKLHVLRHFKTIETFFSSHISKSCTYFIF